MDRRGFLLTSLTATLAPLLIAEALQAPRIALLISGPPGCPMTPGSSAFLQRLGELGYPPGTVVTVDRRCYGSIDEVPAILADVLQSRPDVIVTGDSQAAVAGKKATGTTPIVFMNSSDPVQAGLIVSFSRPGGNATGVGNLGRELTEKRVELLKQAAPRVTRVGVVWNLTNEVHAEMWKSAFTDIGRRSGVVLLSLGVRSAGDIETAFSLREHRGEAVVLMPDGLFGTQRDLIVRLASRHRLPTIHWNRAEVEAGGLMAYGPRPADLPVEQPTKFDLVINLRTAKTLGLTIPPALLARADQVIE